MSFNFESLIFLTIARVINGDSREGKKIERDISGARISKFRCPRGVFLSPTKAEIKINSEREPSWKYSS